MRTIQQDAELKDWLEGLQKENTKNHQLAVEADKNETDALVALNDTQDKVKKLQIAIDAQSAALSKATSDLTSMTDARGWWRCK
jgi:hypothetical protein